MSMYAMVFGRNPGSELLVAAIPAKVEDFGRFRDAWVEGADGGLVIAVYTRCGGGNRCDYQSVFEEMGQQPNFVSAEDDSFDSTYCTFRFRSSVSAVVDTARVLFGEDFTEDMAGAFQEALEGAAANVPKVDMDAAWLSALKMGA